IVKLYPLTRKIATGSRAAVNAARNRAGDPCDPSPASALRTQWLLPVVTRWWVARLLRSTSIGC
ncbi:MAG TPA: hypothetical protein VNS63_19825, partial [Blastocatellia bacterium]|nr:hypothetical protein [Blastocatellia bacterium]